MAEPPIVVVVVPAVAAVEVAAFEPRLRPSIEAVDIHDHFGQWVRGARGGDGQHYP